MAAMHLVTSCMVLWTSSQAALVTVSCLTAIWWHISAPCTLQTMRAARQLARSVPQPGLCVMSCCMQVFVFDITVPLMQRQMHSHNIDYTAARRGARHAPINTEVS